MIKINQPTPCQAQLRVAGMREGDGGGGDQGGHQAATGQDLFGLLLFDVIQFKYNLTYGGKELASYDPYNYP